MAEYIEREALLERIDGIWDCADMVFEPNDHCCRADDCASCKWAETKKAIRKIAANFPAAEVRPVVRGKWKVSVHRTYYDVSCSVCGINSFFQVDEKDSVSYANFCPNCGADMRAEEGER